MSDALNLLNGLHCAGAHTQLHKLITGFGPKTGILGERHRFRKGKVQVQLPTGSTDVAWLMVAAQPRQVFARWPKSKERVGQNAMTWGQNSFPPHCVKQVTT